MRYIGFVYDRNSYQRKEDEFDFPYGESMHKESETFSSYRGMGETTLQKRRVYLDEYKENDKR